MPDKLKLKEFSKVPTNAAKRCQQKAREARDVIKRWGTRESLPILEAAPAVVTPGPNRCENLPSKSGSKEAAPGPANPVPNAGKTPAATMKVPPAKVCRNQCRILIATELHAQDFLNQMQQTLTAREEPDDLELLAVVRGRIRRLLNSCREDNWIAWSLLFQESCDDFQAIHAEIYNIIELLSIRLFQFAPSGELRSRIAKAYTAFMSTKDSSSLEEAARKDREKLRTMASKVESGNSMSSQAKSLLCSTLAGKQPGPVQINHEDLKLKTRLGQGAWLGHKSAVKVFSAGDRTSFNKELKVLGAHKHPNVLHIAGHSFDGDKGQYSLVMEKMDMDLANYLLKKKRPLSLLSRVAVMLEVASGMAWLHSKNIIHRDLKTQNILVGEEDGFLVSVRIADFGVSRSGFNTFNCDGTAKQGTRNFMAPEVWGGESYSRKADVYSYGMLCYHVVTGMLPFEGGLLMKDVLQGLRPDIPGECPVFFSELMQQCWTENVTQRPSFEDICRRLTQFKLEFFTRTESIDEMRKLLKTEAEDGQQPKSVARKTNGDR